MSSVKEETIKGAKWGFVQKLTLQPVQLLFSMVLARLITPTEMGILEHQNDEKALYIAIPPLAPANAWKNTLPSLCVE